MMDAIEQGKPIPAQAWLNLIYTSATFLLGLFIAYRFIYSLMGLFGKSRKYKNAPNDKRYCFLLPARNEELVIKNLIDSIKSLKYPQELIDIVVIADNCGEHDKTAQIAKEQGAIVIERHDKAHKTKGFALQYALNEFKKDHDLEKDYYAYIVMDADNILRDDFLEKLNGYMQNSGKDECVCYRNVKNMSENWIAAMCGINVYVAVVTGLRARSILNSNQQIYATGLCLRNYILKDGWNWTGLTEDLEMQTDLTSKNYKLGYCEEAVFYEEEPTKVGLFIKQQMRWSKGGIIAFFKYSWSLTKSFFKKPTWSKYDIYWQIFPYAFVAFWAAFLYQIISLILFGIYGDNGYNWWNFASWLLTLVGGIYISNLFWDLVSVIREWKRFHLNIFKTIIYIFLFPIYQIIALPISAVSVFMNVKWKHIDHHYVIDPKELKKEEEEKMHE